MRPEFLNLATLPHVILDLRYASTNNFVGVDLYGSFREGRLHEVAFRKFKKSIETLQKIRPGWSFLIFDALRPRSVQKILFAHVVGTDQEKYVADPAKGSIHNYGFALDLSLADASGHEVDMGTGFDDFRRLSQPQFEEEFLLKKELSIEQVANRKLLRTCLLEAGFYGIPHEWWHFEALPANEVREKYLILE